MIGSHGHLRKVCVATHFVPRSGTATRSARGGYAVVPEWPSSEERTSRNKEQTRNVPSSYLVLPHNLFIELIFSP